MKSRTPIWLKFFAVSIVLLFIVILSMTLFFINQMIMKENTVLESNISDNIYYSDLNLCNSLNYYKEQIGSVSMAKSFYEAKQGDEGSYRTNIRSRLSSIYSGSSETIAVFYQDAEGNSFSAGEVFWNVKSQIKMIHECKSKTEYSRGDGLWRYERAGRGYHSIVLCKDIIYVDDEYNQNECGTILLYLDAEKLSSDFFYENARTGIIFCDPYGVIALSHEDDLTGKNYSEVFVADGDSVVKDGIRYLASEKESDISGWKIISYIEMNMTGKSVFGFLIRIIVLAAIGLLVAGLISYMISKRVGRPIEELLSYIHVNRYGEVAELPEGDDVGDIAEIKRVFEAMSNDLRKNIESNYEMQLKLKDITIKAYESQMNPHFLFNTLQMIQMMNVLGKTDDVTEATNSLGQLLRFNLDSKNEVKLSEEVENVINYLKILELRFKGRFSYRIIIPDEIMECYTVKFMLQPLIENTVSHGFAHKKGVCEVAVMGQIINGEIAIVVKDNGNGIAPCQLKEIKKNLREGSRSPACGIGLLNVHERIQLIYGEKYGVDIFSDYTKNTQVVIHLPICRTPQDGEGEYVQVSNN